MNTLITLFIISSTVSSTLSGVTITFQADSNTCTTGKHAYVNVIDSSGLITPGTTNFPYDVVSSSQSLSMPAGWYGQFYVLTDATDNSPQVNSTRFAFDFQGYYRDYIIVLGLGDFTGEIDVTAANCKILQAAGCGYVCTTVNVTATTSPGYYGASDPTQLCDPTTVGSYTITIVCP